MSGAVGRAARWRSGALRAVASLLLALACAAAGRAATQAEDLDVLARRWMRVLLRGDAFAALEAEKALVDLGPVSRPLLERLLREGTRRREWERAARVLGRLGDRRAAPALVAFLQRRDTDSVARIEAARALLLLGDRRGIDALLELLDDGDRSVRLEALILFARFTHRDAGFRFDAPAGERAAALERLRRWWQEAREDVVLVGP